MAPLLYIYFVVKNQDICVVIPRYQVFQCYKSSKVARQCLLQEHTIRIALLLLYAFCCFACSAESRQKQTRTKRNNNKKVRLSMFLIYSRKRKTFLLFAVYHQPCWMYMVHTHCVCIYLYTQKKVNRGVMYVHTEALYFSRYSTLTSIVE